MANLYCFVAHSRDSNWKKFQVVSGWYDECRNLPQFFTFEQLEETGAYMSATTRKRIPGLREGSSLKWVITSASTMVSIMRIDEKAEFIQALREEARLKEEKAELEAELQKLEIYQELIRKKSEIAKAQKIVKKSLTR